MTYNTKLKGSQEQFCHVNTTQCHIARFSVAGSFSVNSNCKLSSSTSDEEMNALTSILAAVCVEPCRLALDDILLQGE